ncbi:hypothetical protein JCM21900_000898 [Sporobolomyces salmonicolor]
MAPAPPLHIPGYVWDGKRYYKAPTAAKAIPSSSQLRTSSTSKPTSSHLRSEDSQGRKRKKARRAKEKGKGRAVEPSIPSLLRDLPLGDVGRGRREKLQHDLRGMALSRFSSVRILYPDCLPMDESIVQLSFDDRDPSVLRVGGSNGSIATGFLSRTANDTAYYPNDEFGWRTGWFFPSKITSLRTCGERILATCLGPPAQAIVGTTRDNISLASVTLSPRKTSLWTSALSRDVVALGCDKKVLISTDPSRGAQMDGYITGGRHGDGAVFALDLYNDLILAGTRKGRVQMFDRRASRPSAGNGGAESPETKDELQIALNSPVTHIRHLKEQPNQVLVAGMDGFLGVYDLRFPPSPSRASALSRISPAEPFFELQGHVNSFTVDLGLDVWQDEFVAAAGQDHRLRIWSLRTGRLLQPPPSPSSSFTSSSLSSLSPAARAAASSLSLNKSTPTPLTRVFSAPLKALTFAPVDPFRLHLASQLGRREMEERDSRIEEGRWGQPSLWVAEGAGVECFSTL